jgi:uncharacterized protein (DUF58 family)
MSHPRPDMLYIVVDACGVELSEYGVAQRERLLRLAATLVEHALVHGWHVGLAVAGESGLTALAPGVGTHHRRLLLDALAGAGDGEPRPLAQVVEAIPRRHVSNAQALVLASSMAMRGSDALATLRRTCRHVSTIGYDRLDLVFDDPLTPLEPLDASGAVHAR